jgi:hypothetical protein
MPVIVGLATWFRTAMTDGLVLVLFGSLNLGLLGLYRLTGWPVAGERELERKLITWKAEPAGRASDLHRQIDAYYRSLASTTSAVSGVALVAVGLAVRLLAWSGHPASPLGTQEEGLAWTIWLTQLGLTVGIGLGYPLAVRIARRSIAVGPRYADLRRRRLADYRAPGVGWLAVLGVALQAAAGTAFVVILHDWRPVVLLLPASLFVVAAELHMRTTAGVPRMVITADPATARRCDDLVRATVIARLQQAAFLGVAISAFLGAFFVQGLSSYSRTLPGVGLAQSVLGLSALYSMLCTVGVSAFEERLGGTITGWWGRPMPE